MFGAEDLTLAVLYRQVYGQCRARLGKYYCEQSSAEVRDDPPNGVTFDHVMVYSPRRKGFRPNLMALASQLGTFM